MPDLSAKSDIVRVCADSQEVVVLQKSKINIFFCVLVMLFAIYCYSSLR